MTDVTNKVRAALEAVELIGRRDWDDENGRVHTYTDWLIDHGEETLSLLKGHVIVPVEPSDEMVCQKLAIDFIEGMNGLRFTGPIPDVNSKATVIFNSNQLRDIYHAMIAPYVKGE